MSDIFVWQIPPLVFPREVSLSRKNIEKLTNTRCPDDQLQTVFMAIIYSGYLWNPLQVETIWRILSRQLLLPEEQASDEEIGKQLVSPDRSSQEEYCGTTLASGMAASIGITHLQISIIINGK